MRSVRFRWNGIIAKLMDRKPGMTGIVVMSGDKHQLQNKTGHRHKSE